MIFRQKYTLQALRRVQTFLDANATLLGPVATGGARAELDAVVTQLTAYGVQQDASKVQSQGETTNQQILRKALRDGQMRPIAKIAKAQLRAVPELSAMKLPSGRIDAQALYMAASAMGQAATPYASTFMTYGLATDFLAQLAAAAAAFQGSLDARGDIRTQGVGATAGVKAETIRARNAAAIVDALVAPLIANDDSLVAEWKQTKRLTLKPGGTGRTTSAAPITPVPPPSPTPSVNPATPVVPVTPVPSTPSAQPVSHAGSILSTTEAHVTTYGKHAVPSPDRPRGSPGASLYLVRASSRANGRPHLGRPFASPSLARSEHRIDHPGDPSRPSYGASIHTRETRQILALCHVQLFLDQVAAPALRDDLGAAAIAIGCAIATARFRVDQRRATARAERDAASAVRFLRERLWCKAIQPVARIGRLHLSHIPEIAALRTAPRSAKLGALALAAVSMADGGTRHHAAFAKAGLPEQMAKTLRSFVAVVASKDEAVRRFLGARAAQRRVSERALCALYRARPWLNYLG